MSKTTEVRSLNVDRMRRYSQRGREERRRAEWWASLTPEHRAKHEGPHSEALCSECIAIAMRPLGRLGRRATR